MCANVTLLFTLLVSNKLNVPFHFSPRYFNGRNFGGFFKRPYPKECENLKRNTVYLLVLPQIVTIIQCATALLDFSSKSSATSDAITMITETGLLLYALDMKNFTKYVSKLNNF